jgi:hypothetical protein
MFEYFQYLVDLAENPDSDFEDQCIDDINEYIDELESEDEE